ncbi:hypothetical protein MexAM1_META2p1229 (plasmid) [Methylorubrum extorquens AM1]|uniref:Uncharacterized protein n=1 Tax=Methylorubrum extorquens (strain ATCC 14718 / DSM 1338 / JCM 2805 / NCIMB 9133 / AM1) TaxID=272630 RepID=C5B699_METEA|nr:hypothetical protein MexAM1_META2p1229 [Methylorubrum extorquens AM1]
MSLESRYKRREYHPDRMHGGTLHGAAQTYNLSCFHVSFGGAVRTG